MNSSRYSRAYERWAPLVARVLFGGTFLMGAAFKIPGTQGFVMESGMTAAMGLPYASIFVAFAFLVEVLGGLAIILGWHARAAALVLAVFTLALALIFYTNFSDQMVMGEFISHLGLIAGLLYVSVYGAQTVAVRKDWTTVS
ncbi:MAG: DoxX family protein [Parcubacteria group bacterium]|nr:DoxX family protein [Parcubacteria group bacterium]